MQVRYGYKQNNKEVLTNAGMSCEPMNTQTAERWYKESKTPIGAEFFIDVAHDEKHDEPEKTFLGIFVLKWRTVTKKVWTRIYVRKNVDCY